MQELDASTGKILAAVRELGLGENTWIIYLGDHGFDLLRGKRTSLEHGIKIPLIIAAPSTLCR